MKQNYIKKINSYMPNNLKKIFAKSIRNRLIKNKVFLEYYKALEVFDKKTKEEKDAIQMDKLKEVLIDAYENIAYYKREWEKIGFNPHAFEEWEELKSLPVINKEIVLKYYDDFLSEEPIKFYHAYSGGTTGTPTKYTLETDSIYKEQAFKYHHFSRLGYDYKKSRLLTFRTIEFTGNSFYKYNPVYSEIIVSPIKLNVDSLDQYLELIEKLRPDYIQGYPSGINTLCKLLNILGRKISGIKGVFFISENVTQEIREYVEATLGCKSLDFYGHTERSVFGEEVDGHYNFHQLYGYTELIDSKNSEAKRIVCTGFLNKKMPLIRYDTGDKAIVKDDKVYIEGRFNNDDVLYGKEGENFSLEAFNFCGDVFNKVIYHQIVQEEKGVINFNVNGVNLTQADKEEIEKVITLGIYEGVHINFNYDREIIFTTRGKYRRVIQNITA